MKKGHDFKARMVSRAGM